MRGEAPTLKHAPADATVAWEGGRYVVRIKSKHDAREVIGLEPVEADWEQPWQKQRLRVLSVMVEQEGIVLYEATLLDHQVAKTSKPWPDPDGLGPAACPQWT